MTWAREAEAGEVAGVSRRPKQREVIAAAAKRRIGWQQ